MWIMHKTRDKLIHLPNFDQQPLELEHFIIPCHIHALPIILRKYQGYFCSTNATLISSRRHWPFVNKFKIQSIKFGKYWQHIFVMASGVIWAVPLFYHLISFCWAVFVDTIQGHSRRFKYHTWGRGRKMGQWCSTPQIFWVGVYNQLHFQPSKCNFPPGEGYSENFWIGVCCWDSETLNLYQTAFSSNFPSYSRLDAKNPYPILD